MLGLFNLLIFILCPFLALFIVLFGYFCDYKKNGFLYSLLIGIFLGIIAYHFIPLQSYDLTRHHMVVSNLMGHNFSYLIDNINAFDIEIFPLIYSFMISKIGNIDLQQFFIVSLGYFIIFYTLQDYRKISKTSFLPFLVLVIFTFFGFNALNFISGLWYYIAMIIFFLALYLDYYKGKSKKICYALYIGSLFMHTSMFFLFLILIIYKVFGNKLTIKNLLACVLIFTIPTILLDFLTSFINIEILNNINWLLNVYFDNDQLMHQYYSGFAFYIEILKLIITILIVMLQYKNEKFKNLNGLIIVYSICTIIMMFKSIVMIRFIMLIQFLGIGLTLDYFSRFTKKKLMLLVIMLLISIMFVVFFFRIMSQQNFGDLFNEKIFYNFLKLISS